MKPNEFQILLIDDDEDDFVHIRSLLSELTHSHYKITWKPSFSEGLEALIRNEELNVFDACLLDYRLGEHTGLDILNEVRDLKSTCPIIFLTSYGDFDLDLKAMETGASDYLLKGSLTSQLIERSIRYSMKHASDLKELRENRAQILQQDRLASLGLLASSLAHEIGTPLGIIRSRAEFAEKKALDNESLKGDMGVIITQIDRISKLVNSLLHLSRGGLSDHASAIDLNQVIDDVLTLIEPELNRKSITLDRKCAPGILVKAERGPLGQVFLNLVVNAIHAIEEAIKDGTTKDHCVEFHVEIVDEHVIVTVSDTGCGISEKNISQIFKPFFTTKDVGVGTGLGLATSYKLVQSWGGTISVKSKEGKGAKFTITLLKK